VPYLQRATVGVGTVAADASCVLSQTPCGEHPVSSVSKVPVAGSTMATEFVHRRVTQIFGCFPAPLRASPLYRRVGVHDFTFEACSSFSHITACRIAQPPEAVWGDNLDEKRPLGVSNSS